MIARRSCVALLLPDSGKTPPKPAKLIIPGRTAPQSSPTPQRPLETTEPDAKRNTYRPPMGYFFKTQEKVEDTDEAADIMIQRLSAGSGIWYVLAASLPKLNTMGYDAQLIENLTGIPKGEQSILVTAASVLQSIRIYYKEQNMEGSDETLEYFDTEGTHFMLYELRFLDVEHRASCAEYVVKRQFRAVETKDLARATKEYYRRGAEETGFESSPEDILAYKYYRNALESREQELMDAYVMKGLDVAQSKAAKDQLEAILGDGKQTKKSFEDKEKERIQIYRLLSQEVKYRPVPYAGLLTEVNGNLLSDCPKATTSGEFSIFEVQSSDASRGYTWKWIALPNWPPLAKAKQPVALLIKTCAEIDELKSSIRAKSDIATLKLSGSGLLVVDVDDESGDASYYLTHQCGQLQLTSNADLHEHSVVGRVLFVCRPPDKDNEF